MAVPQLAILFEHTDWFKPLFAELIRRGVPFVELNASRFSFDPAKRSIDSSLVLNRMSPSAFLRGHGQGIFFVRDYLRYLEGIGVRVINSYHAYLVETSKTAQIEIIERLGLPYPRTHVFNHVSQALVASEGLEFPVVVKPNIGGSGANIQYFATKKHLEDAVRAENLALGFDQTALVQEFLPARDGAITRVEIIDGSLLYAIRIFPPEGEGFNLCPADICQDGESSTTKRKPDASTRPEEEAGKRRMRIERFEPPEKTVRQVLAIAREAKLDVGGIEYLVNDRDGNPYFYDINALSNFVTDGKNILGFDPYVKLVDFVVSLLWEQREAEQD